MEVAVSITQAIERPDAPYDLTDEESTEWWAVVNRMPADWFPRETHPLLAQYCRHAVAARRVSKLIEREASGNELDIEMFDRLLKMQEREGRALSSLATRMRISQQSGYDKERKRNVTPKRPWD